MLTPSGNDRCPLGPAATRDGLEAFGSVREMFPGCTPVARTCPAKLNDDSGHFRPSEVRKAHGVVIGTDPPAANMKGHRHDESQNQEGRLHDHRRPRPVRRSGGNRRGRNRQHDPV